MQSEFDMLAAALRADAADAGTFLEALAVKLEGALPGMVWVEREGGLFKKEHRVKAIRLQIEDKLYELSRAGGGLEAKVSQQVRGIVLKNELVHLDAWITAMSQHLTRHAETSTETRVALERLVT